MHTKHQLYFAAQVSVQEGAGRVGSQTEAGRSGIAESKVSQLLNTCGEHFAVCLPVQYCKKFGRYCLTVDCLMVPALACKAAVYSMSCSHCVPTQSLMLVKVTAVSCIQKTTRAVKSSATAMTFVAVSCIHSSGNPGPHCIRMCIATIV